MKVLKEKSPGGSPDTVQWTVLNAVMLCIVFPWSFDFHTNSFFLQIFSGQTLYMSALSLVAIPSTWCILVIKWHYQVNTLLIFWVTNSIHTVSRSHKVFIARLGYFPEFLYKNFTGKFKTSIGTDFCSPKFVKKNQEVVSCRMEPGSKAAS